MRLMLLQLRSGPPHRFTIEYEPTSCCGITAGYTSGPVFLSSNHRIIVIARGAPVVGGGRNAP
jgi:hypothetical protein